MSVPSSSDLDRAALAAELGGPGAPVAWADLTWPEAGQTATAVDSVIIPVGATEQHGPHLPLAVDTLICDAVACLLYTSDAADE